MRIRSEQKVTRIATMFPLRESKLFFLIMRKMQPIYSDCDNSRKSTVENQKYKSQGTELELAQHK